MAERPCTTQSVAVAGRAARMAAGMIRIYQYCLSGLKPPCCRFQPSCSQYAREAILSRGVWHGAALALRRLLRCHPFYRGPVYDPVPPPARPPSGAAPAARDLPPSAPESPAHP